MSKDESLMLINGANINENINGKENTSNKMVEEISNKEDETKNDKSNFKSNYLIRHSISYNNIILDPDYINDNSHYFFDVKKLISYLKSLFKDIIDKYPIMFEPYKNDLIEYTKEAQEKKFEKKIGVIATIKRGLSLLVNQEQDKPIEKQKAKDIAYLLSQLNGHINTIKEKGKCKKYIEYFNENEEKFLIDDDPLYETIDNSLSIEVNYDGYNEYIIQLNQKTDELLKQIMNLNDKNKKYILINYLIRIVNEKIIDINNSSQKDLLNQQSLQILENINNSMNKLIEQYNYISSKNVKFFYDILFDYLIITKNTQNEKEAIVPKNSLDSFVGSLEKEFNSLKTIMELEEENKINEKEGEIDYKEKCEKIIQYLQNKIIEFEEKI